MANTNLCKNANAAGVLVEPVNWPEVEVTSFFCENEDQRVEAVVRRGVDQVRRRLVRHLQEDTKRTSITRKSRPNKRKPSGLSLSQAQSLIRLNIFGLVLLR